jgi:hypothetical protein
MVLKLKLLLEGHWHSWQQRATTGSWEFNLTQLIKSKQLEVKFLTFPLSPPGNDSVHAKNHAHRSDFVRMTALSTMVIAVATLGFACPVS